MIFRSHLPFISFANSKLYSELKKPESSGSPFYLRLPLCISCGINFNDGIVFFFLSLSSACFEIDNYLIPGNCVALGLAAEAR